MAGMGPPPNPNARHRKGKSDPLAVVLPAGGYAGPVPDWPLPADVAARTELEHLTERLAKVREDWQAASGPRAAKLLGAELDALTASHGKLEAYLRALDEGERTMWAQLWRTPMADQWARLGWARDVALYVRCQLRAESGDMTAAAEARQRGDRLGMSPLAQLRLHWVIDDQPAVAAATGTDDAIASVTSLYG